MKETIKFSALMVLFVFKISFASDIYWKGSCPLIASPKIVQDNVDLYTGNYLLSINLMTMKSINVQFPINLLYNSNLKDIYNKRTFANQASVVGLGWQLDVPYFYGKIVCSDSGHIHSYEKIVYVSNGGGQELTEIGNNKYKFKNFRFWDIVKYPDGQDITKWKIIDENGYHYYFSEKCDRLSRHFYQEGTSMVRYQDYEKMGFRWYLSKIEDPFGNCLEFKYEQYTEKVSDYVYMGRITACEGYDSFTKEIYLDKIIDHTSGHVVKFSYGSRLDDYDELEGPSPFTDSDADGDSYQELIFSKRLAAIKLYNTDPDSSSNEICMMHKKFYYGYDNFVDSDSSTYKKLILDGIKEVNPANENMALPMLEFDYIDTVGDESNTGALAQIHYATGGIKNITYEDDLVFGSRYYVVDSVKINDGYTTRSTVYDYWDVELYDDSWIGHSRSRIIPQGNRGWTWYYFNNPGEGDSLEYTKGSQYSIKVSTGSEWVKKTDYSLLWDDMSDSCYYQKTDSTTTIEYFEQASDSIVTTMSITAWDTTNGLPTEIVYSNTIGPDKVKQTTYAYNEYSAMLDSHMLVQPCEEVVYKNDSGLVPVSSSITTWASWTAHDGKSVAWAPERTYLWLENDATPSLPSFDGWSDTPTDTSEWRIMKKIMERDEKGLVLSTQDGDQVITSTKYCRDGLLPVATIINAEQRDSTLGSECGYIGFEAADPTSSTEPDNDYWCLYNDSRNNTFSTDAYSGRYSRKIRPAWGGLKYGPTRDFEPPSSGQDRNYVISCWVKTDVNNGDVYLYAHDKTGDLNQKVNLDDKCEAEGTGDWEYLECRIDLGETSAEKIRTVIVNENTSDSVLVDELRFYPLDAQFSSTAYDTLTFRPITRVDNNSYATRTAYDKWHRPFCELNNRFKPVSSSFSFLSRRGSTTDEFEDNDPNYSRTINSSSAGFFDSFSYDSGSQYTLENSVSQINWKVLNGCLEAICNVPYDSTPGHQIEYYWNDEITFSDFVLECDVMYDDTTDEGGFIIKGDDSSGSSIRVDVNPTRYQFLNASGGSGQVSSDLSRNEWHHVCIVSIDSLLDLYVDGQLKVQTTDNNHSSGFCGFFSTFSVSNILFDNFCILPDPAIDVSYSDGVGRVFQSQRRQGNDDIIAKIVFNEIGKKSKQYLPQDMTNSDHDYIASITGDSVTFEYEDTPIARLKKKTHSDGSTVEYTYNKESFTYDPGQSADFFCVQVTDEQNETSKTFTDKFGNKIGGISASGTMDSIQWAKDYDILGNVVKVRPPNFFDPPTGSSASDWDSEMSYNTLGQLVKSIDPDEGETWYVYNKAGNLRFSQNAFQRSGNHFSVHYYDPLKRVTWVGEEKDVSWSSFDSPPSIFNPSYGKDADEWKQKYYYDSSDLTPKNYCLGRLAKVIINADSDVAPEHITSYVYDQQGRITEKHISLDGVNPLSKKVVKHVYDFLGRETQLVYPSGNTIIKTYNHLGQLDKIMSVK